MRVVRNIFLIFGLATGMVVAMPQKDKQKDPPPKPSPPVVNPKPKPTPDNRPKKPAYSLIVAPDLKGLLGNGFAGQIVL